MFPAKVLSSMMTIRFKSASRVWNPPEGGSVSWALARQTWIGGCGCPPIDQGLPLLRQLVGVGREQVIDALAGIALDARADRADTDKPHAAAASAQMVSLAPDGVKRCGAAAHAERAHQLSDVGHDAGDELGHLFDADGVD